MKKTVGLGRAKERIKRRGVVLCGFGELGSGDRWRPAEQIDRDCGARVVSQPLRQSCMNAHHSGFRVSPRQRHPNPCVAGVKARRSVPEPDLPDVLLERPRRTVLNKDWRWGVWYPLRRNGQFSNLSAEEQRVILAEHGAIGRSFGAGDLAHDVRLACHGLDKNDNDFVVGLVGKELFPLSAIVQAMRKTQQTSLYLERLGPFFVGRALWQSAQ